ncbi:hypothetical protein [Ruegeria denitrificans]|uniref:hypothetical protein n=1 Tax=Ruegeria denitrificans TaxID=1715692 RepID=UPI000A4B7E6C|nr:hypothetical protein [Ruegeria denitrificans]
MPHQGHLATPRNTHKYRLLDQEPNSSFAGGREWLVSQSEFPISTTVTGVVLELEPKGMREFH